MKRMLTTVFVLSATIGIMLAAGAASAHFGTITPSTDILSAGDARAITLALKFIHPMEGHYMEMVKPKRFGVVHQGKTIDLLNSLSPVKKTNPGHSGGHTYWTADYSVRRPGDHTFFMEPVPYWEPAEDLFIVHYTKVCVNAFGLESGWDEPVGLETEIVPLTRPYGLWTGNLFTGQVLLNGKPVAHAEVEVEYLNESSNNISVIVPPADPYVTQVVKADANGVFSYAMPKAGWWGFSALSEADWTLNKDGSAKGVEIGAVYWVRTRDMR